MQIQIISILTLTALAFIQNVSFSIVSRSRNRNNMTYHIIAAVASNMIWFVTFRQLMVGEMTWILLPGYTFGTVTGSVFGVKISMMIERMLDATSDGHLKKDEAPVKAPYSVVKAVDSDSNVVNFYKCTEEELKRFINFNESKTSKDLVKANI